jgi:signal transduction histidine kinase
MPQSAVPDSLSLAGLAAANGPWLTERLLRLAGHAGQPLTREVAEAAVESASRVLGRILAAEGRPALHVDEARGLAVALGSEQALAHQQAGLSLPASLKVQRLLRRAYDDLVRESWVEKDSRARAHEDVERFFERALAGLVSAWTGQAPAPARTDEDQAELLAQREDQLRRTLEAAQRLTAALRESRERAETLAAGLALARRQSAESLAALRAESAAAQKEAVDAATRRVEQQAEAERQALAERVRELEEALAAHDQGETARRQVQEQLDQAQAEARHAQAELRRLEREAATLRGEVRQAAQTAQTAQAETSDLREAHAILSGEAEAMRARLAETGSRLAAVRAAESEENLARLNAASAELAQARERIAALEEALLQAGQEAQARGERLEERLAGLERDGRERAARAEALSAERDALSAERDELSARLKEAEAQVIRQSGELAQTRQALDAHLGLTPDAVAALDVSGRFSAWNANFLTLFGLDDASLDQGLEAVLPRLADCLQKPEAFVSRVRELLASPCLAEAGMPLATLRGQTLVFRSAPGQAEGLGKDAGAGLLFSFHDVSLEHDMEQLVREIEGTTRFELGQSLTAFIHLPQEMLDDPATTPAQAKKLAAIRDSGYRIVNTVNMAVDLFRMERGLYRPPAGRSLDLAVALRRAAKDVAPLAASRRVTLSLLLDGRPLPKNASLTAPGDPILALALAANLLRDALEAAPQGSEVRAALRPAAPEAGPGPRLEVSRPGQLAPDEADTYFDKPLAHEPDQGLRRPRYAARLIARTLGGGLDVASSEDAGVTVRLTLAKE